MRPKKQKKKYLLVFIKEECILCKCQTLHDKPRLSRYCRECLAAIQDVFNAKYCPSKIHWFNLPSPAELLSLTNKASRT